MAPLNINSQPGNDAPNPPRVSLADKFESLGEFQKKAFEYPVLFVALAIVYSLYLKSSLDRNSCPTGTDVVSIDLALLLPALKFFLITGGPCALLASLDRTWRGQDSAYASLAAYAAMNVFWIHKFGGGYCPYCVLFGLVAYIFSAGFGHGLGLAIRSLPLPGKNFIMIGGLVAFFAAQTFNHFSGRNSRAFVAGTAKPTPAALSTPVPQPASNTGPQSDFSATAQKAAETPHFWQLDPRGGFLNGGKDYCGPVAVSDSLMYLGRHGFPNLLPDDQGDHSQIGMINLLASSHYLGTDPNAGTSPAGVLRGLEKFVVGHGYQCTTMEYKGWTQVGPHEREFVLASRPDLDWMKRGVLDPHGTVWLIVGWYNQTGDGQWKRTGGHWVTMVGFDAKDPNALLIHNPGTRGNGGQPDDAAQDVIHLKSIDTGTLVTGFGPDQDASGRYQISGPGLPMNANEVAFLDAAIVLVVSKL